MYLSVWVSDYHRVLKILSMNFNNEIFMKYFIKGFLVCRDYVT